MIKKKFTKIKNFFLVTLLFLFKTKITEQKLRKMFCRVCELDYSEPMNFGWFELQAYGNSIAVSCFGGDKFVMNESEHGLKVSVPRGDIWECDYESKTSLRNLNWYLIFKLVYDTLYINHVFETRQRENIEKAQKGIMQ